MEPIHNRMPVIVPPKNYSRWMAPADPAQLPVDLFRPYPVDEMEGMESEPGSWQREEQSSRVGRAYLTATNRGRNALPLEKV